MPDYAIQLDPTDAQDMSNVIYRFGAASPQDALTGIPNNVPSILRQLSGESASFTCSDGSPAPAFAVTDYGAFANTVGSATKDHAIDLTGRVPGDLVFVVSGPILFAGSMKLTGAILVEEIERSDSSAGGRVSIGVFRMIEAGSASAVVTVNYVDDDDMVTPKNTNDSIIEVAAASNSKVVDIQISAVSQDGQTLDNVVTPTNARNEILSWVLGGNDAFGVGRAFTGVTEVREVIDFARDSSQSFGTATDVPVAPRTITSTPPAGTSGNAAMISLVLEAAE